ncbi:hypothetical protein RYX36_030010, partial [Vicia faba]
KSLNLSANVGEKQSKNENEICQSLIETRAKRRRSEEKVALVGFFIQYPALVTSFFIFLVNATTFDFWDDNDLKGLLTEQGLFYVVRNLK